MADRVVSIKLIADATGIVRGFNTAKDAAGELKAKVTESARTQREEWSTVGTGLTAVGVTITGLGVAVLKTGIAYNTLQQTSRAAMTTLLGSASAANEQMDKLDAFARESPFSKQTFITAQQQMLAFGIETEKVLPYLDAVQNGVAAMGGSNQQISEIAFIMAQISAASKITAQDLMQFGQRGINAADLIGSQMGMTGAQIREEITAGTLDAGQALDALAAGMEERYSGAAANVKNTFEGSIDRVKAAWRDFASELAKPLVDPNGGGALIDLLNWTADAMRNFQKLPEPVKATASALTGLVGVGALLGGTAMLAIPRWVAFKDALADLQITGSRVRGGLGNIVRFLGGPLGIALMAAAATVAVFNMRMEESKVAAKEFETGIKQSKSALDMMQQTAEANEQGLGKLFTDVQSQVENLPGLLDKAATSGRGFWSSLSFNEQAALDNITELGSALATVAGEDLPRAQREFKRFGDEADLTRGQLATALDEMPAFKDALLDMADGAGIATDDATLLKIALGEINPKAEDTKNSLQGIQGVAVDTTDAIKELADEILNFGSEQIDAERSSMKFREALSDLRKKAEAGEGGLSKNTEAGRENLEMLLSMAEATSRAASDAEKNGASNKKVTGILREGREAIIEAAEAWGWSREKAKAYADEILATPKTVTTKVKLDGVDAATAALNELARDRTINMIANLSTGNMPSGKAMQGATGKYNGGTVGYARGGTIQRAATGLTIDGIGGGISAGTVYGAGTSKSDSVMVRLSRGEEVTQEPYASLYRAELKAINRGDFRPSLPQSTVIVRESSGQGGVHVGSVTFEQASQRDQFREFEDTLLRVRKGVI